MKGSSHGKPKPLILNSAGQEHMLEPLTYFLSNFSPPTPFLPKLLHEPKSSSC